MAQQTEDEVLFNVLIQAIENLHYCTVDVTEHEARVTQIEKREKVRLIL